MLYHYRRLIKLLILVSALMLLLGLVSLAGLHWYVSTESFKKKLTTALKNYTGYDLVVEGDMGVTLYPWIGFAAGPVSLLKPGVDAPLLSAQRVSTGVRLLPFLSGELDLDIIVLEDVVVEVVHLEDGSTHWDDLIIALTPRKDGAPSSGQGTFQGVTMRGVQIENGAVVYRDVVTGRSWEADGFNLRAGELTEDRTIAVSLETRVVSLEHGLSGQVMVTGSLGMDLATGDLRLSEGRMDAEFQYPALQRSGAPIRVTATVDVDTGTEVMILDNLYAQVAGLDIAGSAQVTGLLSAPLATGHVDTRAFSPREFFNDLFPDFIPEDDMGIFRKGALSGDIQCDGETVAVTGLDLRMDDSHVSGSLRFPLTKDGSLNFDLALDSLDFDRYYRLFITPEDFILDDFFPEFIRTWRAGGGLTAGTMIVAGEETQDVALRLNCGDGLFRLMVDRARVMGGEFEGEFSAKVAAEGDDYRVALSSQARLVGARAESLPLGASEEHLLSGRGDLTVGFETTEKVMALDQIIDDLIRDTHVTVNCSLGRGELALVDQERGGRREQALSWKTARLSLALTGDGLGGEHDDFGFQAGAALKLIGRDGSWDMTAKLSGPLALDFPLENLRIRGADLGVQYHGPSLPEGDPVAVLSAVVDLDTLADTASASKVRLEAAGMDLTGRITGKAALSEGYSYSGRVNLASSDPARTLALLRGRDAIRTRDPEALKLLSGWADVLVTGGNIDLTGLTLILDQTKVTGRVRIRDLGEGRVIFDLKGDQLDLDRYRSPRSPEERSGHEKCSAGSGEPPTPLPLDTLRVLDVEGALSLDVFKVYGFRHNNVRLGVEASDGLIAVSPVKADFYGGRINGSLGLFVGGEALEATLDMDAVGFMAEDFLGDQFERDYVRGLSELHFHFKTSGATGDDLIERLNGSSGVVIRDGSYRFLGVTESVNRPSEKPKENAMVATGTAPQDSRTAFSLAKADFAVTNGRFDLTEFQVKALALSATGEGYFDVAKNSIDLALNADFVAVPDVPIYIEGCLSDPDVSVPGDEIIQNAVEDIISIPLRPLQYLRDSLF